MLNEDRRTDGHDKSNKLFEFLRTRLKKKQKCRTESDGKEAKVQEKQAEATHENKTKHNLARDTDVWKNPNSYKHLPS